MSENILIVDDEADIRNLMKGILADEGYQVALAADARQAYEQVEKSTPDLVVLDIWLQGSEQDGLQILNNLKKTFPNLPIIMISGHGTIETAVAAIKQGAYDFIEKPFKSDRLLLMIRRALETAKLRQENEVLKKKVAKPPKMIGQSHAMQSLRQIIERVAPTNSRVMLTGEAGSGKDIAARTIHSMSARANKPFLVVNCASLRPDRLEGELFGSDKPGAESIGMLEQADKGTLFLDEVADMPLETQAKIMRVLQEQRFTRVRGQKEIQVDVRIIASTNRNLDKAISEGKFRQDLFYRLNVVPAHVPCLRDRIQDLQLLLDYFVQDISEQSGLPPQRFTAQAIAAMQAYAWPGNIRQLRNAVEWAMIMKGGNNEGDVDIGDLPPDVTGIAPSSDSDLSGKMNGNPMLMPLREAREIFERDYLQAQITRFGGNISKTAQFVGMERSALHRKLKSLQILGSDKEDTDDGSVADNVSLIKQKRA
jgi:two-component system nitrogen regulation response regulator NtrX